MKPTAVILNMARGKVIDVPAAIRNAVLGRLLEARPLPQILNIE
jgi:lactate dehydrogenase-like 2-hydroxyacid dehydrogenase